MIMTSMPHLSFIEYYLPVPELDGLCSVIFSITKTQMRILRIGEVDHFLHVPQQAEPELSDFSAHALNRDLIQCLRHIYTHAAVNLLGGLTPVLKSVLCITIIILIILNLIAFLSSGNNLTSESQRKG